MPLRTEEEIRNKQDELLKECLMEGRTAPVQLGMITALDWVLNEE